MRQYILSALLAALVLAWASVPSARAAAVTLNVHAGDAPPPPAYVFDSEPEVIVVPQSRVYYVPEREFDLYRYGRYWYINRGGWWYRAPGYRGPFENIEQDRVPVSVLRVPPKYRRHPLDVPPGQVRRLFERESGQARPQGQGNAKPKKWNRKDR